MLNTARFVVFAVAAFAVGCGSDTTPGGSGRGDSDVDEADGRGPADSGADSDEPGDGLSGADSHEPGDDLSGDPGPGIVGPIPPQWIAKQYTALLGRAPTAAQWHSWLEFYGARPCDAESLWAQTTALVEGTAFADLYPDVDEFDRVLRAVTLLRAAFDREPQATDWAESLRSYTLGTTTWAAFMGQLRSASEFETVVVPAACESADGSYDLSVGAALDWRQFVVDAVGSGDGSRTQQQLQTELDSGGTVTLRPGELIVVGGSSNGNQGLHVPAGSSLVSAGLFSDGTRSADGRAIGRMGRVVAGGLTCNGYLCNNIGIVAVEPGGQVRNVWVDGSGAGAINFKLAGMQTHGSGAGANRVWIVGNYISGLGRDGVGIRLRGAASGVSCQELVAADNLVTGYRTANRFSDLGQALWADGIAVHCEGAEVADNDIVDVTDAAVMLHGAQHRNVDLVNPVAAATQRSHVHDNTIIAAARSAHVALGIDAVGECRTYDPDGIGTDFEQGLLGPCLDVAGARDFTGAQVTGNIYWTGPTAHFDIGLMVGGDPLWGEHRIPGSGAEVTNNTTPDATFDTISTRVNMGVTVLGHAPATMSGNTRTFSELIDGMPGQTWGKCPEVAYVVAGDADAAGADGCLLGDGPQAVGERMRGIEVGTDTLVFAGGAGVFRPWGYNYAHYLEAYWNDDWSAIVADFRELRRQGVNTIRLVLQTRSYITCASVTGEAGPVCELAGGGTGQVVPIPGALEKLADLVRLAEETGLYLDITGLDISRTFDLPDWYGSMTAYEERWAAQEVFWAAVSSRVGGHPSVVWFDLMNEPAVPSNPDRWCFQDLDVAHGHCWVQNLTLDVSTHPSGTGSGVLADWAGRMTASIRDNNPVAPRATPIGIGPIVSAGATAGSPCGTNYKGLVADGTLDIMLVHSYPPFSGLTLEESTDFIERCKPDGAPMIIEETATLHGSAAQLETYILDLRFIDEPDSETESSAIGASGWLGQTRLAQHALAPVDLLPVTNSFDVSATEGWQGGGATLAVGSTARSGTQSAALTATGTSAALLELDADPATWPDIRGGELYTFEGFVYGASPSTWSGEIDWHDSVGVFVSSDVGDPIVVGADTWTALTVSAIAPATAAWARPRFVSDGVPGSGEAFHFDDIEFLGDCFAEDVSQRALTPIGLSTQGNAYLAHIRDAGWSDPDQLLNKLVTTDRSMWPCEVGLLLANATIGAYHSMFLRHTMVLQHPHGVGVMQP